MKKKHLTVSNCSKCILDVYLLFLMRLKIDEAVKRYMHIPLKIEKSAYKTSTYIYQFFKTFAI